MSLKTDSIIKPHTVKVQDLDSFEGLLKGLKVAACMLTEPRQAEDEASVIRRLDALTLNDKRADGNCCSCCGIGPFKSRADQINHYKNHWHTHNLKRKLFGKAPLTYNEFDLKQKQGDSSDSGSDSETENSTSNTQSQLFAAATRHCKAFFTNAKGQVFCVYRCILHKKKEDLSTDGDGSAWVERCQRLAEPGSQRWAILMVAGGNFAGAVFSGNSMAVHKTHRSYVTRRGQGQSQATRDQQGNAPKSAGASLRRYNQAQFTEHVQNILTGWAKDLEGCYLIFYRAVGPANQAALFGKNSPIKRNESRVRQLPFPTRKPSHKEVLRVYETLSSVEVYDSLELFQKDLMASSCGTAAKSGSDSSSERKKANSGRPTLNRARSRVRPPRELPSTLMSDENEDSGPCYIDSETPIGWIKTLSEQVNNGDITNPRRDLLQHNQSSSSESSDEEEKDSEQQKKNVVKKKKKRKPEVKQTVTVKKVSPNAKISENIKKMWKTISDSDNNSLVTILGSYGSLELEQACNTRDPTDGNTALHKAAIAANPDMVTQLLSAGGDPCVRNNQLQTPYAATSHNDTRFAFRLFQAQHPDKYNYGKSQIPGPLTPELLEQEKEKKAQQKKAKRQREKEKQIEKLKMQKFLQLTDMEKVKSGEYRCFLCGTSMPQKDVFGYNDYRFCSPGCLKNHRSLRPLQMSV